MAYTSIIPVSRLDNSITYIRNKDKTTKKGQSAGSLEEAIDYAMNRDKTERSIFEDAIGCVCETAYQDMVATKKRYHKMDGVQGFHLVQSFAKGEVTPELAHRIGMELAKRLLQGKYEAVITTHLNTEHYHKARAAKKDEIVEILKACTNIRDRLLMLLLAETGYRIGEILGIDYSKDIDYRNHIIRVYFREDNENGARAKNAEYRSAKISKDTFDFLNLYIAEYRKLLQHQTSLFVNISGDNIGKPMNVEAVYSMLKRMDKKTGIKK